MGNKIDYNGVSKGSERPAAHTQQKITQVTPPGPRSSPLLSYIPFLTERVPFCIPSNDKWYPFHIPSLEICIPLTAENAQSFNMIQKLIKIHKEKKKLLFNECFYIW